MIRAGSSADERKNLFSGLTEASRSGIIPLSPVRRYADLAQLVEQLIRNEQVAGSIPVNGSIFYGLFLDEVFIN